MALNKSLLEIAKLVGGVVVGDESYTVSSVATIQNAESSQISFLSSSRYRSLLDQCGAGAILIKESDCEGFNGNAILVKDPYVAYAKAAALLHPIPSKEPRICDSAVISPKATIQKGVYIGENAVIGDGVTISPDVEIGPGCVIADNVFIDIASRLAANVVVCEGVKIGKRVILHPGVVLGSDGFGLANENGKWVKVPQVGSVRIGDDVEIGSNTTIDRGAIEDTVLENGVKLDNQIQVAHNVHIGAHTAIAACTGIAGSAKIGTHCAIGGGVGVLGHLEISDRVTITAMSLVTKSVLKPGIYSSGTPLEENHRWHKNFARFKQLDEIARRLRALEKKL